MGRDGLGPLGNTRGSSFGDMFVVVVVMVVMYFVIVVFVHMMPIGGGGFSRRTYTSSTILVREFFHDGGVGRIAVVGAVRDA